jgi:formamidopyrimidine-DNA glycosylase
MLTNMSSFLRSTETQILMSVNKDCIVHFGIELLRFKIIRERNAEIKAREMKQYNLYVKDEMECEGCHRWKVVQKNCEWYCPTCQHR